MGQVVVSNSKASNQSITRVIEVIREHREVSRRVIAKETGLSTPSITRLVNELIEANILSVNDNNHHEGAGPGRPASVVMLNPTHCCAIGVAVGEQQIQTALCDMSGRIQLSAKCPTSADRGGQFTADKIIRSIHEIREMYVGNFSGDIPPLRAITISVPGTVSPESSLIVNATNNIRDWVNFTLKEQVEQQFPGVTIRIENDINAAAIAESAYGVARECSDFVFVSFRKGIGAGIFIDGKLYRGHSGFAGEIGKIAFSSEFNFSDADGAGHFETICSEKPLVRQAVDRGVEIEHSESGRPTLRGLCMAAINGDSAAKEILEDALKHYAVAVANIASLFDPAMVVIGGEIRPAIDMAITQIRETVGNLIPSPPTVIASSLAEQASLKGCLYQAHKDACDTLMVHATVDS
jgi:predicted NBD/HSP70 family sugar kinase